MKNIYFLSGLPRSGNTLLSALLNQNPNVYVSPLSPLLFNLQTIENSLYVNEETLSYDFTTNTTQALKQYVEGFYKHIEKPVVLDRNKAWGNKDALFTSYKYITDTPKIIYTVRDIHSILKSFLRLIQDEENNFVDNSIRSLNIIPYGNQSWTDVQCDWLMNNQISSCLRTLTQLLQTGTPVYLVEYDNLIMNTQEELNHIYSFLQLEPYAHNLQHIEKIEKETLVEAGLPHNLHDVSSFIKKTENTVTLSELTKEKYSNLEFWRHNK